METNEIYERSKLNAHTYRLISYTLVALMMVCAAITFVSLASRFSPDYQPYYLLVLCFIVALDRLYTYRIFNQWTILSREWNLLFATHAIVIIAITKIAIGLSHGWDKFLAEIPTWSTNLPLSFLDAETTFSLFLILGVWLVCGRFAEMLEEIGPDQIQSIRLDLVANDRKGNISARQRLIHLYFWVGAILAILTILSRIDIRMGFTTGGRYDPDIVIPTLAAGGASTLIYFMLGLALLSQTQFISLHIRWNVQRIPISGKLTRQWTMYSMIFLVLIAAIVSLVPTSYGIQPLIMLGYALNVAVIAILYLGQLMLVTVMTILSRIFGSDPPGQEPLSLEPPDMPASPTDAAIGTGPDWLEIIKGLIFWAIFASVVFWAIRQYLRQNPELLERLRGMAGAHWFIRLLDWLRGLWTQVKSGIETITELVRRPTSAIISEHGSRGDGFINLRKLDPRQKIYFFYLAFIRRAGEKKLPRSSHQTPDEYAATVRSALPEAADDIQALTQAFVSARYSRQPVEAAQAHNAETIWVRLRKALRRTQPTDKKS